MVWANIQMAGVQAQGDDCAFLPPCFQGLTRFKIGWGCRNDALGTIEHRLLKGAIQPVSQCDGGSDARYHHVGLPVHNPWYGACAGQSQGPKSGVVGHVQV